uniref:glycosyltransferase n=1 Tax=Flavobacterium sp. TaxID=239 RepID=UPI00404BA1D0
MPTSKSNHRKFLQLFPYAIEQFDLKAFDLVISSSSSIAKGVLTTQDQLHICYCHSPMRYAWDLYHQYLDESGLNKGIKGAYAKYVLHKMRNWDIISVNRVDHFIANSKFIQKRIKKVYNRDSTVIYPPSRHQGI